MDEVGAVVAHAPALHPYGQGWLPVLPLACVRCRHHHPSHTRAHTSRALARQYLCHTVPMPTVPMIHCVSVACERACVRASGD